MSHDLAPLLGGKPYPTAYATEHLSFLNHDILLLQEAHLILISSQHKDELVYVKCTPSEFIILARLLASSDYAVPFEELSPHLSLQAGDIVGPLQRHISRLKKKLPPGMDDSVRIWLWLSPLRGSNSLSFRTVGAIIYQCRAVLHEKNHPLFDTGKPCLSLPRRL